MKRSLTLALTTFFLLFLVTECDRPDSPSPDPQEFGYLSLNVDLQIEARPASGRIDAVSPDNFLVTIHNANDGTEVMRWDTYAEVPTEVQLPTGSYFVRATNLEFLADAAFGQPWYFGESDVFTIDKEEIKTIDVECTLANCKISFSYSQNVMDNFTNWDATATIDDGAGTGAFLEWIQDDPAEGYFLIDAPINIEVFLEYIKLTDPDQSITRTFNATIENPTPATHYLINVDAALEDGKVVINISVNEDFETVEIDLGDAVVSETVNDIDGNEYATVQIGDQLWMAENLRVTQLNDGTPIPNPISADEWNGLTTPAYSYYSNDKNTYGDVYGALYNFFTVETGNICPTGWHVPTKAEWEVMVALYGGTLVAGGALKSTTPDWRAPNEGATNESGFTGLPGGARGTAGNFYDYTQLGFWWVDTEFQDPAYAYEKALTYQYPFASEGAILKNSGFSIRCLKD
ncbi:MAG: FISUMP domain-containing protein [Bacteroidota bacterium]